MSLKLLVWSIQFFFCVILVNRATFSYAGNGGLGPIVNKLGALSEVVLEGRCDYYFGPFSSNALHCRSISKTMMQRLGQKYELEGKGFNFIVYEKEIVSLLKRSDVQNYLRNLSANPEHVGNLYDWTLSYTGGDKLEAIKWLGVLFEDVSINVGSVPYLKTHYGSALGSSIDLLAGAIRTLQSPKFILYPSFVNSSHSNAIYHFYLSAYAAGLLQKEQHESESWSSFEPFLMNLAYGIIFHHCLPHEDISNAQLLLKLIEGGFDGCWNVKSLNPESDANWLANTYLSYAGTKFVTDPAGMLSENSFSKDLSQEVRAFVRSLVP